MLIDESCQARKAQLGVANVPALCYMRGGAGVPPQLSDARGIRFAVLLGMRCTLVP